MSKYRTCAHVNTTTSSRIQVNLCTLWLINDQWGKQMTESVRLTKREKELIRIKAVEVNKKLMAIDQEPLKDSEIVHEILKLAIEKLDVNKNGQLVITEK